MRSKLLLAALLPVLFIACNNPGAATTAEKSMSSDSAMRSPGGEGGQGGQAPSAASAPAANPDWDKKIIKTADLQLEVRNFASFSSLLHATVRRCGGYMGKEEQSRSDYRIENKVMIRVPVGQFDEAVEQLTTASDSNRLLEKKIGSEDVSLEVVDTKSRMEAKLQVRAKYMELLKQARNMDEILKVQNEINGIQEQIEAASGRIGYLDHSAAFSTINLDFYQVLNAGTQPDPEPSFFHKLKDGFGEGWKWCSDLLIGIASLWPIWLGVFLVWFGFRRWRKEFAPEK